MKTSIATVCISGTLGEKLKAISDAGFDGIEIFEQDFLADDATPKEIGRRVRDHGLEITLFQPFRDFECLPEPLRSKAFDRAERKFDLMQELGTDLVLICSSVHPQAVGGIDRAADDLRELGERAAKRDLKIGYEALAWGRFVSDHRDAWEIVRRCDHDNVGLILDSFHTLGRKIDPQSIRAIPGDKIFFVQLADAPLIEMDLLYWSRHFRNMPGEGDLPVIDFMRAVAATGYAGHASLEVFNDQFRGGNTAQIAKDGYRSLIGLLDSVKRSEPQTLIDFPSIPERAGAESVSFVEFATQDKEQKEMETLLRSLGFSKTGQHKARSIGVWQQGDIRIVLNSEKAGHAADTFQRRGTSVCDLGIRVKSANETADRARALGADFFAQPRVPGELEIPAVSGFAGSVMHFIDTSLEDVWSIEFDENETEGTNGAGLTSIDHIAQTMGYDEMLSWSLFFSTLFEMEKSPIVDVIDPDGLVRSQALSTKNGKFHITLNGAESLRTFAGSFLAKDHQSAVQHIAFSTQDIFATAEKLNELSFKSLPIPDNYYADLQARFDLEQDLVQKMKELNILYDRKDEGELFQLYSQPFSTGIFFEIVERKNAFIGFGAPNAPFRVAAQKRLMQIA